MSLHQLRETPGNWHAAVLFCQHGPTWPPPEEEPEGYNHSCEPGCDHRCDLPDCQGRYDLGVVDYWHPNPLRMIWWRLWMRPRAVRRSKVWNRHVDARNALEA